MARRARTLAATTAAITVLVSGAAAADAAPYTLNDSSVVSVGWHPRFRFNFDQGESLKPGTRVPDVTGHGHYGVVQVSGTGHLTVRRGVTGKAAGYPRDGGRAIIKIAHNAHLNPHRHPFTFGASVRVRPRWAKPTRDPNIVQKGLFGRRSNQWKLQLIGAKPSCVFNGTKGQVNLRSKQPIDDGKWHQLVCRRVGQVHTLFVDGLVQGTATLRTGSIANSAAVTVGGRAVGTSANNDQFHGNVDNVFLKVGTLR